MSRYAVALLFFVFAATCAAQGTDVAQRKMTSQEVARRAAEIERRIVEEIGPRKTYISSSTREVGYAMYYKEVARKIEEAGTSRFPQKDGKKLYGSLIMSIPIFQDGSLHMKNDGPRVEKSSGDPDLDQAALAIVRSAAPFTPIPAKMRTAEADDVWVMFYPLNFVRREAPEPQAEARSPLRDDQIDNDVNRKVIRAEQDERK